jgi:hypothetical protein
MGKTLLAVALVAMAASGWAAPSPPVRPFETDAAPVPANAIDEAVLPALRSRGIEPARPCSDEVFLRRAYLDVIGTLPTAWEVQEFMKDPRPDKRVHLVDTLLEREEFAAYWAMRWCDVLRVKAEFPINLWPNAVQAYHRWIYEAMRENKPYDAFARELLTASGSSFRVPPVNFYRAVQARHGEVIADAVALTFMGARLSAWPEEKRSGMAAFFSRIRYKPTAEWKEEIVCLDPEKTDPLDCILPDGSRVTIQPGQDPRRVFADWLLSKDNPWFARAGANRIWGWLMGRGVIEPLDDIRDDNPPSNGALLACLEGELVTSGFDMKHMLRLILNSRAYQQSCIAQSSHPQAEALFAYYPVRRLDAEVLIDALCRVSGTSESYSSPIPEPFTYIPEDDPTIELADGSISSGFLEMFGRPPRDTGLQSERSNEPTDEQRLHLLNSTHVQRKIEQSGRLQAIPVLAGGDRAEIIRLVYLNVLSRFPTDQEAAAAEKYFRTGAVTATQGLNDLAWALINSKEFLYRH